jgi:hypothetical protein
MVSERLPLIETYTIIQNTDPVFSMTFCKTYLALIALLFL